MSSLYTPLSDHFIVPSKASIGASLAKDPRKLFITFDTFMLSIDQLKESPSHYLCGNSLGLQSKKSRTRIHEEIDVWASRSVIGHFSHPHDKPWVKYTDALHPILAELVGAKESEVVCMSTLTTNLHLMMNSFYKPTPKRFKILCEARAFPSDQYAFASQAIAHGFNPDQAVREVWPREGEYTLREEDILKIIEEEGQSIALVIFSGVQYYTGQLFPMEKITRAAKAQGCICGWDLAHAIGNVPLTLHDWDVDFAVWCTYKYVNSGPGGIAGLFIHEKWDKNEKPKFTGWWGHELSTRFKMPPEFSATPGAQGFQQSNPCVLAMASLLGSLQTFKEAGMMGAIRERSLKLTSAFEKMLQQSKYYVPPQQAALAKPGSFRGPRFTIITPSDPESRGAQLSLLFLPIGSGAMQKVFDYLCGNGVIGDEREPDVIRLAPAPLYNTLYDCEQAVLHLNAALDLVAKSNSIPKL